MEGEGWSCGEGEVGGVSEFKWVEFETWNLLLISSGSVPLIKSATVRHNTSRRLLMSR